MKLKVDPLKCDTTGTCVKQYPTLFRFQTGSKKAEFIPERLPTHLESECLEIVEICPTGAISVE